MKYLLIGDRRRKELNRGRNDLPKSPICHLLINCANRPRVGIGIGKSCFRLSFWDKCVPWHKGHFLLRTNVIVRINHFHRFILLRLLFGYFGIFGSFWHRSRGCLSRLNSGRRWLRNFAFLRRFNTCLGHSDDLVNVISLSSST